MNAPLPPTSSVSSRTLLALTEAMEQTFDASSWAALGLELDMPQLGDRDSRLQESLRLRDDDYGYFIAQFLRHLQDERPGALGDIARRPGVKAWLDANAPDAAPELGLGQTQVPPPRHPEPANEAPVQASKDVGYPPGASASFADKAHAALRDYLRDVCARVGLPVAADASVTQLFESLRIGSPELMAFDRHAPELANLVASLADAVTVLDSLRNRASISQPEQASGKAETMLMVDLARTLFGYLEARLQ